MGVDSSSPGGLDGVDKVRVLLALSVEGALAGNSLASRVIFRPGLAVLLPREAGPVPHCDVMRPAPAWQGPLAVTHHLPPVRRGLVVREGEV